MLPSGADAIAVVDDATARPGDADAHGSSNGSPTATANVEQPIARSR